MLSERNKFYPHTSPFCSPSHNGCCTYWWLIRLADAYVHENSASYTLRSIGGKEHTAETEVFPLADCYPWIFPFVKGRDNGSTFLHCLPSFLHTAAGSKEFWYRQHFCFEKRNKSVDGETRQSGGKKLTSFGRLSGLPAAWLSLLDSSILLTIKVMSLLGYFRDKIGKGIAVTLR